MDLDPSSWYRLIVAGNPQKSLVGSYPYLDDNTGLVTIADSDVSTPSQQWQLATAGSSTYLLRTKASGVHGYLAVRNYNGTCEGSSPVIYNRFNADESMLWTMQPDDNGTFALSNTVGEDDCILDVSEDDSVRMSSKSIGTQPGQKLASIILGNIDDPTFSVLAIPPATRVQTKSTYTTANTFTTSVITRPSTSPLNLTSISTSYTKHAPSTTPSSPPLTVATEKQASPLSSSAAIGVGVAVGIAGLITLLSIALLIYRCCKLRHSPSSRHYQQAKLWKGFTPATPSTARTTFVETKMANIYFAELPTPATPAFMLSPPLEQSFGHRVSWIEDNRASWQSLGLVSPVIPGSPPVELPT